MIAIDDPAPIASLPGPTPASWFHQVKEYFFQHDAARVAHHLTFPVRIQLARDLIPIQQKTRSAGILAANGQYAEAFALATVAFQLVLAAAVASTERFRASGAPPDASALQIIGLPAQQVRSVVRLGQALPVPLVRNSQATATHKALFQRLRRATEEVYSRLHLLSQSPDQFSRRCYQRVGSSLLMGSLVALAIFSWTGRPQATASDWFEQVDQFGPEQAIDGNPATEWILKNGSKGWLEVRFRKRDIHSVHLLNAKNVPRDPRAIADFRLELFSGSKLVASVDRTFGPLTPTPRWLPVPLIGRKVDRIRLSVKSVHKAGGGLAEISWE